MITQMDRQKLCQSRVTLDGKPAIITGWKNNFATVKQLPNGSSFEWSWETAYRIIHEKNGEFKS